MGFINKYAFQKIKTLFYIIDVQGDRKVALKFLIILYSLQEKACVIIAACI